MHFVWFQFKMRKQWHGQLFWLYFLLETDNPKVKRCSHFFIPSFFHYFPPSFCHVCAEYEESCGCAHLLQANCVAEVRCWCLNRQLLTDVCFFWDGRTVVWTECAAHFANQTKHWRLTLALGILLFVFLSLGQQHPRKVTKQKITQLVTETCVAGSSLQSREKFP